MYDLRLLAEPVENDMCMKVNNIYTCMLCIQKESGRSVVVYRSGVNTTRVEHGSATIMDALQYQRVAKSIKITTFTSPIHHVTLDRIQAGS